MESNVFPLLPKYAVTLLFAHVIHRH